MTPVTMYDMSVHTRQRAVRRQLTLPADVDARLRQIAAERGESQSAIVAEAIRNLPEPSDQLARMLAFVGTIKGGGTEPLGRMVDEIVYGEPREQPD
jgi:predicted transcriptional regulator